MLRPRLVRVTVPMIIPMITQQTPTEIAPLAPSVTARIILSIFILVSARR